MTDSERVSTTAIVTRAVFVDRQIASLQEELKGLKQILTLTAQDHPADALPTDGGGRSWTFAGADGCIARVSCPAPTLRDKIAGIGKTIERIQQAAGKAFPRLFEQIPAYRPVQGFRDAAIAALGPVSGRKLIKLCSSESAPRVSFETKDQPEPR